MNAIVPHKDQAKTVIDEIADDLRRALPATIPLDRFKATFVTAVLNNPDILACDHLTLKTALMKSAMDKLMPDNREAAIVPYNTKVKGPDGRDKWIKAAQYMPMVQGIRKRALELGGVRIAGEVVYQNDKFLAVKGDSPRIEHEPSPFGTPRGEIIGAYAIFRLADGEIVHRETMPLEDIETIRSVSKAADGPGWTKFFDQFAIKSVVRRGSKSVPSLPDELRTIIERDDDYVDLQAVSDDRANTNHNPLVDGSATRTRAVVEQIDDKTGEVIRVGAMDDLATRRDRVELDRAEASTAAGGDLKANNSEEQRGNDRKSVTAAREGDEPKASAQPSVSTGGGAADASIEERPPQTSQDGKPAGAGEPSAAAVAASKLSSDEIEEMVQYAETLQGVDRADGLKEIHNEFWESGPPAEGSNSYLVTREIYGIVLAKLTGTISSTEAHSAIKALTR